MMKRDLTWGVYDANGKQSTEQRDGKDHKVTVRDALERALLSDWAGNPGVPLAAAVKTARYKLWQKINGNARWLEITSEELATLKSAVEVFPTLVYGQLVDFLERDPPGAHAEPDPPPAVAEAA